MDKKIGPNLSKGSRAAAHGARGWLRERKKKTTSFRTESGNEPRQGQSPNGANGTSGPADDHAVYSLVAGLRAPGCGPTGGIRVWSHTVFTTTDSVEEDEAPQVAEKNSAKVAELADALDLGSSGETLEGSSPSFRIRGPKRD